MSRLLRLAIMAVLTIIFVASGAAKLAGVAPMLEIFERFRLPVWFMYLTGIVECAGGLGLLLPMLPIRGLAAALLCTTMIVGAGFHFAYDEPAAAVPALTLALMCGWFATTSWNAARRLTKTLVA